MIARITLPIDQAQRLPSQQKVTLNKTPNYKQQKKRREDEQKKRNLEKQRQQAERKVSDLPPEKS